MASDTADPLADLPLADVVEDRDAGQLEMTFDRCLDVLASRPPGEVMAYTTRWATKLAGVESAAMAQLVDADGDTKAARNMMRSDKQTSGREKNRKTRRAKAAAKNADLSKKMRRGHLSPDQMDNIADAAEKDPAAATDQELIEKVSATDPEQGRKIAHRWLDDRQRSDDVNAEHQRQRALRAVRKGIDPNTRLHTLTLEGDKPSIDQMWARLSAEADKLYQHDGGRDVPIHKHPRSLVQRLFDSAHQLITGTNNSSESASGSASGAGARGGGRPVAVVTVPLERLTGNDPTACVTVAGQGPIPDRTALGLLSSCDLFVQITSRTTIKGQPLWQGRLQRHATTTQYIALAVRDRGCAQCSAPPERCHVHHLTPWHAPAEGETNLDNLVLLCPVCHTSLHEQNLTLHWDTHQEVWATRPAAPHETPPTRPTTTPRSKGNSGPPPRPRRVQQDRRAPTNPRSKPAEANAPPLRK